MQARAVVAAFLLLALPLTIASAQRVLKVPSQYKTIQAAIDAAKDKDTVLVAPGTYKECIDFKGKRIKLVGRDGPASTIIDGQQRGTAVRFQKTEDRSTELTGFTITGGRSWIGAGIFCNGGSPTIIGNVIMNNVAQGSVVVFGGGLYVSSPALVVNNVICFNTADPQVSVPNTPYLVMGGGISAGGDCVLANNIVFGNRVFVQTKYFGGAAGGGISSRGTCHVLNNTIFGNSAFGTSNIGPSGAGGGIDADANTVISNCVVFANKADYDPQVSALSTEYSCIEGGFPGLGNISSDPRFVDPGNYDFHLRYDSPCRNKGNNATVGLPGLDFEGDPRIAGGTVDIGADEFFPHLYQVGSATPGGKIEVRLIGNPNDPAIWAFSSGTLSPPVPIPGLKGMLHLNPANLFAIPIGQFPATGVLSFPVAFPSTFPRMSIPTQALIGLQLSNLDVVHVQ